MILLPSLAANKLLLYSYKSIEQAGELTRHELTGTRRGVIGKRICLLICHFHLQPNGLSVPNTSIQHPQLPPPLSTYSTHLHPYTHTSPTSTPSPYPAPVPGRAVLLTNAYVPHSNHIMTPARSLPVTCYSRLKPHTEILG